ncbi:hypothetical protein KW830_04480 [Comamonas sp. CMM03]|uniref:hypothetical protein n=1 Tax=Comamonas sp. CMM03 TaxID=2854781 RepID=UPI001C4743EF|nr:hypothetical protein [Comamonas sp. CMM03]MBV7417704.1 hypothetical protein [Comamonas sp. CMM03]
MNTLELLKRIAELDASGACVCDAVMLELLSELPQRIPVLLQALDMAWDASASLENVLLTTGQHMTPSDQRARGLVADNLAHALDTLGVRA